MKLVHATLAIDPEMREDFFKLGEELAEASNREEGIIDFHIAMDIREENTVHFIEVYADGDARDAHQQTEHLNKFADTLPSLLADDPDITEYTVRGVADEQPKTSLDN